MTSLYAFLSGGLITGLLVGSIVWNYARAYFRPKWGELEMVRRERNHAEQELLAERIKSHDLELENGRLTRMVERRLFKVVGN